ncbi:MAG: methionyl-tRNA formyltransferase [Pseudomonadota bacterium]
MRLAFMGTPAFAATALGALIANGADLAAVYTRAPQAAGRGKKLRKTPVHELAETHGLPIRTPSGFKSDDEAADFEALNVDAAIVVAYGLILPQRILDAPGLGCFNLHASLLPRWRGAAPIQRAIMAGDAVTGVQVMQMEAGLDTGPILLSETTPIHDIDTAQTLHDRLAEIGASLLPRFLAALSRGGVEATPQSADGITYAEKISSAEARLDWSAPADVLDRKIRGLSSFPGAWFEAMRDGAATRVKALFSKTVEHASVGAAVGVGPGTVLEAGDRLIIACGGGAIDLPRVQRAGKGAQSAAEFLRGFPLAPGDVLS